VERQAIRANLQRIISLAERMNIPGSPERIEELARHAMNMMVQVDSKMGELGLIASTLANSVTIGPKDAVKITDPELFRWAARESCKRYKQSGEQDVAT
jgi:hypothetical protein